MISLNERDLISVFIYLLLFNLSALVLVMYSIDRTRKRLIDIEYKWQKLFENLFDNSPKT